MLSKLKNKTMNFTERKYITEEIITVSELAILLKCCCAPLDKAYKIGAVYLFNDSADADSIQEFAVFIFDNNQWFQVDTLSVSLMNLQQVTKALSKLQVGTYAFKVPFALNVDLGDSEAF